MPLALFSDVMWTAVEREVAAVARDANSELRTLAMRADLATGPESADHSALYAAAFSRGLHRAAAAREDGGMELPGRARAVLLEELARGDAGIAFALSSTWGLSRGLKGFSPQVKQRFLAPCLADETGAWLLAGAVSEPEHGSDAIDFVADRTLATIARPDAAGYVLDGTKWMMTNGARAALYAVIAQREGTTGYAGRVLALVPAGAGGMSAVALDKQGLRTVAHATLTLTGVQVPTAQVLELGAMVPQSQRAAVEGASVAALGIDIAAIQCGLAQAIADEVGAHTLERRQGGKPLRAHQAVAVRLSTMNERIAQARATVWLAAEVLEAAGQALGVGTAARSAALEAVEGAARDAVHLVGAPALLRGRPLAKLLRDAACMAPAGGALDFVRLLGATPPAL